MPTEASPVVRLGTRGSVLARMQSQMMADELERRHPGLRVELSIFKTSGDMIAERPLQEAGGKGLFVRELEQALLDGGVDLAVHSFKDVPVTMPLVEQEGLTIAAVPPREDARDVLVAGGKEVADLLPGARVGTGSLRRRVQLLHLRPDLQVQSIRGNVDTRLRKFREGQFDAIVLAMAGLKRAGLFDSAAMRALDPDRFIPAAGQGALALQCRRGDAGTLSLLIPLHHEPTALCARLERDLVRRLGGDCYSPIAVLATIDDQTVSLRAAVGGRGGELPLLLASGQSPLSSPDSAVQAVYDELARQNVHAHLGE